MARLAFACLSACTIALSVRSIGNSLSHSPSRYFRNFPPYLLIAVLYLWSPDHLLAAESSCHETVEAQVVNKEFIESGVKYRDLKKSIVQQALLDAVQQTLGTEVRSHSGMKLSSTDGNESEQFKNLMMERARGLVKSYQIVGEDIVGSGDTKLLEIKIHAVICIPDQQEGSVELVAVGDFKWDDGQKDERLRSVLLSYFPENIEGFTLVPGNANNVYHDIEIHGKVLRARREDESSAAAQNQAAQNQASSQAALQIMSGLFGSKLGVNLGGLTNSVGVTKVVPTYRIIVEVEVRAIKLIDHEVISERAVKIKEKIPHDVDPASVGNELVAKAVEDAAKAVYQKLFRTTSSRTLNKKTSVKKANSKITGRDQ